MAREPRAAVRPEHRVGDHRPRCAVGHRERERDPEERRLSAPQAPQRSGFRWALLVVGLAAFAITFLIALPARLIAPFLPPQVGIGTLEGSIWRGSTDAVEINGQSLGAMRWQLRPLQLFIGRLAVDVELDRRDGQASAGLRFGLGGKFEAQNVEAHLPIDALPPGIAPRGWGGAVRANLSQLALPAGAVPRIQGTVELRNLKAPPPQGVPIGSYRLVFDAASKQKDRLVGRVQDIEGPMQVTGTLSLGADRSYVIDGMVAPREGATQAVTDTLRFLGPPDSQGRRPFSVAGTY